MYFCCTYHISYNKKNLKRCPSMRKTFLETCRKGGMAKIAKSYITRLKIVLLDPPGTLFLNLWFMGPKLNSKKHFLFFLFHLYALNQFQKLKLNFSWNKKMFETVFVHFWGENLENSRKCVVLKGYNQIYFLLLLKLTYMV